MHTWLIAYTLNISQKVQSEWASNCSAALYVERTLNGPLRSKEGNHLVLVHGTFVNPSDICECLIHFLNLSNESVARIVFRILFRSQILLLVVQKFESKDVYFILLHCG